MARHISAFALVLALFAPLAAQSRMDADINAKIRQEENSHSQIMKTLHMLADVYGPRVTGSPSLKAAGEWAIKEMQSWGFSNGHLEPWDFGHAGWVNERFSAHVTSPVKDQLTCEVLAWTPGTNGPVTGDAVVAVINEEKDFAEFKGKLRGKYVLSMPMRDVAPHFDAQGKRYTDAELADLSKQPPAGGGRGRGNFGAGQEFNRRKTQFWIDEGVAAVLDFGRGDGGTVFVQSPQGVSRDPKGPAQPAQVTLTVEHYGRIWRTLDKKIPVTLTMDIANTFYDADQNAFNVVAELPGTDKADEVVMIGGHFDSWHTGTGATDNAAGSAIMMEAMRLLKVSGAKLRRTVRIGLWGGEEEGLLGSREYVKAHYADPAVMQLKPEHAKFAGYFNVDNGTGLIRGVYLQGNEAVAPIFQQWMEPFKNMGMTTLTIRNTGGTDHLSYDAVGLPGFQFIQDEVEYDSRTHHSNMDTYERVQANDMMRNAVIVASFVLNTANRDDKLPRKPLPKPTPPAGRGTQP